MKYKRPDHIKMDASIQFQFNATIPKAIDDMMLTGDLTPEDYRYYRLIENTCKYDRFFIRFTPPKIGGEWAEKFGYEKRRQLMYVVKTP